MADLNSVGKVSIEPNSIQLPECMEVLSHLDKEKRFAIDIGCSLTKIAYYSATKHGQSSYCYRKKNVNKLNATNSVNNGNQNASALNKNCEKLSEKSKVINLISEENDNPVESTSQKCNHQNNCEVDQMSRLHFVKFQTKCLESCLEFIENHLVGNKDLVKGNIIKVTGGGVCKYAGYIKEKLGLLIDKEDETCCLIKGTNFLLRNVAKEAFSFQQNGNPDYDFQSTDSNLHPYLLVNIGSGVSIIKVTNDECYEKIGGLSTGGATFWGLGSLLTSAKNYDDLLKLAENGDYRKVDMLVRDIFGNDYNSTGLSGDSIAASFGKINCCNEKIIE